MTSAEHKSGTDRCAEALSVISKELNTIFDIVVNIQGDEPFIQPEQLRLLISCFDDKTIQIATLVKQITNADDIFDANKPKVVLDNKNRAIYFSRSPIPYLRNFEKSKWLNNGTYYKHIGLYAYRTGTLNEITKLQPSSLELAESLEQLRWIENGYNIGVKFTLQETVSIDTPDDLRKIAGKG
jgi:3-deoxy-manno-octulosonate cytidylyltransferase (CMP-KDO synthetase)